METLEPRRMLSGQTITVNVLGDTTVTGHTTLRDAISTADKAAGGGDKIVFAPNLTGTIILTQGPLNVTNGMTINGLGANQLTVSGNNRSGIFEISSSTANVSISGLTLSNGLNSTCGGGAIFNAGRLTIANLTISNNSTTGLNGIGGSIADGFGFAGGGGIYNQGTLTSTDDTFSGNMATGGANTGFGGGIYNGFSGTVTSSNDTFSGNGVTGDLFSFGGGIENSGKMTMTNDTVWSNTAIGEGTGNYGGAGISNDGVGSSLTSLNDLIANNIAFGSGNLFGGGVYNSQTWNSLNTIVAENPGGDVRNDNYLGGFTFKARNTLIGDTSSGLTNGVNGNIINPTNQNIFTQELASNGGPTQTLALVAGSPAIGAGGALATVTKDNNSTLTVSNITFIVVGDALKIGTEIVQVTAVNPKTGTVTVLRAQDGTNKTILTNQSITLATDQTEAIRNGNDLGARNSQHSLTVNTIADDMSPPTAAHATLRNAIAIANADVFPFSNTTGDTINFASDLTAGGPATITLIQGELTLDNTMTITGSGASRLTVSGNNNSRIFDNSSSSNNVRISGLTLANGFNPFGGAIFNGGTLTMMNDTISDSSANGSGEGGGIFNSTDCTLTSIDNTIIGNSANSTNFNFGGGIFNFGTLTSTNDIISGNSATGGSFNVGGGIANYGTMSCFNDAISGNSISGNGDGAGILNEDMLTTTNDTIAGNSAGGSGADGGGIANWGTLQSTNDTIAGNSDSLSFGNGGGVFNSGVLTSTNDTIAGNFGNGVDNDGGGNLAVWNSLNTIVAGNFLAPASTTPSDVVNSGGIIINASFTLIGDAGSSGGIINGVNDNIVGKATNKIFVTDSHGHPLLANNGGPTQTIALAALSPAVDHGASLATSTASIAQTSAVTTIAVGSSTFITSGDWLRIDNEVVRVTAVVDGTHILVQRGQNGTAAASHLANAPIKLAYDETGAQRVENDLGAIAEINHAPVGTSSTVMMSENTIYSFKLTDFGFTDPNDIPANTFLAVKITTLPLHGKLTDNGVAVTAGARIPLADIMKGHLQFTPVKRRDGVNYASFTFQVQDNGGTANGGIDTDLTPRKMTITVT